MAYVRSKVIRRGEREYRYFQLVEGYRDPETGKVRQRVLEHLGRFDSIEDAREAARELEPHRPQHSHAPAAKITRMRPSPSVQADGAAIRRLMRERGIGTGAELARRSGVSAGVVNRLRRNRSRERFVQRDNLERIASALSVPLDALIWRA